MSNNVYNEDLDDEEEDEDEEEDDYDEADHMDYSTEKKPEFVKVEPPVEVEIRPIPGYHEGKTLCIAPGSSFALGPKQEATCLSLSQDGTVLAVGCRNGKLLTFNPLTLEPLQENSWTNVETNASIAACTAVRFRPDLASSSSKNVALVAKVDKLFHCHCATGTVLHTSTEEGNCINAVETRSDGSMYATAGTDRVIRVYDETTRRPFLKLKDGDGVNTAGHSNNIYSIAWKPEDWQVLVTAGWDKTVQIWDMREGKSVRSIYGPYVCGDGVDVLGKEVLTGSWRHDKPLQLWDYGGAGLISNVPFKQAEPDGTLLYAAKYTRQTKQPLIVAAGSGKQPMMRIYTQFGTPVANVPAPSSVYSLDSGISKDTNIIALCCAFHICTIAAPK